MSRTVDIPGGTAVIRDADELTGRQSDLIEAATISIASLFTKVPGVDLKRGDDETEEAYKERLTTAANEAFSTVAWTLDESTRLVEWRRAMVFATLDSWSIDRPLPKTIDELADLPGPLARALNAAVGGSLMQVATDYTSPDTEPDSPTTDCGSLNLPSKGDPQSNQISSSPENTGTSGTAESTPA